jgi:hypothetical protein
MMPTWLMMKMLATQPHEGMLEGQKRNAEVKVVMEEVK